MHRITRFCLLALFVFPCLQALAQAAAPVNTYPLMVPYRLKNKWGYADTLGKIVIKPQFDSVGVFFYSGKDKTALACFSKNGKLGLMNPEMKPVLPNQFTKIDFSKDDNVMYIKHLITVWNKNLCGSYDLAGKQILPVEYESIDDRWLPRLYIVKKAGKFGLLNSTGSQLTPIAYDAISYYDSNPAGFIGKKGNEEVFIDFNGKTSKKAPQKTDDDDEAAPMIDDYMSGVDTQQLIKQLRLMVQKIGYDSVYADSYKWQRFITRKGNKFGIIKSDGIEVIPPQYDQVLRIGYSEYKSRYIFIVRKGSQIGMVNEKNEVLIPFDYTNIKQHAWKLDYFYTYKGNKKGCTIFATYYPPIPAVYEEIDAYASLPANPSWSFVLLQVKKNGKWGFVGENGVEFFKN